MDNENMTPEQRKAERQKALRFQRNIRVAAILLAIVLSIVSLVQSCATKKAIEDLAAQIAAKKAAEAQTETIASPSPAVLSSDDDTLTLSFVGTLTLASPYGSTGQTEFETYYDTYGEGYFFQNIRSVFQEDDLTVASLGCSLTTSDLWEEVGTSYRADPSYAGILKDGGIDAVAVSGSHVMDFGEEGYVDTLANLDNEDIQRFGGDYITTVDANGVLVGLTAVNFDGENASQRLQSNIEELIRDDAQLIVAEISAEDAAQAEALTIDAVDWGADVVILYGAEEFGGIEQYNNAYICHNMGRFLSGGDTVGRDAIILQLSYHLENGLVGETAEWNVIPVTTSSDAYTLTYCPTAASGTDGERIMAAVFEKSAEYPLGITESAAS